MDPSYAASAFYGGPDGPNSGSPRGLLDVNGWEDMQPSHAAHAVQVNTNRDHYTQFLAAAQAVVTGITCTHGGGEWMVPAEGTVSSHFGVCGGVRPGRCHLGADLANGTCFSPLWAASAGTVISTGFNGARGGWVEIDHGDGIITRYFHIRQQDILVHEGDQVDTGTPIGRMGNAGHSYGCHLHFEVIENGKQINPEPFMADHGAPLPQR